MGSAATSMSSLFNKTVVITTPTVQSLDNPAEASFPWVMEDPVVVVSFRMEVGNLIDSFLVQVIPAHIAKEETALLMGPLFPSRNRNRHRLNLLRRLLLLHRNQPLRLQQLLLKRRIWTHFPVWKGYSPGIWI